MTLIYLEQSPNYVFHTEEPWQIVGDMFSILYPNLKKVFQEKLTNNSYDINNSLSFVDIIDPGKEAIINRLTKISLNDQDANTLYQHSPNTRMVVNLKDTLLLGYIEWMSYAPQAIPTMLTLTGCSFGDVYFSKIYNELVI